MNIRKVLQPWPLNAADAIRQMLHVLVHSSGQYNGCLMLKVTRMRNLRGCFCLPYFFAFPFVSSFSSVQKYPPTFLLSLPSTFFALWFCYLPNFFLIFTTTTLSFSVSLSLLRFSIYILYIFSLVLFHLTNDPLLVLWVIFRIRRLGLTNQGNRCSQFSLSLFFPF